MPPPAATPRSHLFPRRPARRGSPPERRAARAAQRDFRWCWTGVSGWGRIVPQGYPGEKASGRATWEGGGARRRSFFKRTSMPNWLRLVCLAELDVGAIAQAHLCHGHGTLPGVSAGHATAHRSAHCGERHHENSAASEAGARPTGHCASAPRRVCVGLLQPVTCSPGRRASAARHVPALRAPALRLWEHRPPCAAAPPSGRR